MIAAPCPPAAPSDATHIVQRGQPQVLRESDGRITVFIGGGYRVLTRAEALAYARRIVECVEVANDAPSASPEPRA